MLTIRNAQMKVFEEQAARIFAGRAVEFVARHWPARCSELGPEAVQARVQRATARAQAHGFANSNHVLRFINLNFALGEQFDTYYAWAVEALARPGQTAEERMRSLEAGARRVLRNPPGPQPAAPPAPDPRAARARP